MPKVIEIVSDRMTWHIPLEFVARHRAKYYAEKDTDTTEKEEFDYVMEDDSQEGLDWFINNMDWSDVSAVAKIVRREPEPDEPNLNECDFDIIETDE